MTCMALAGNGQKFGETQTRMVVFSADYVAISAKSGEGYYSEAVVSWGKSVFLPILDFGVFIRRSICGKISVEIGFSLH